MANKPRMYEYLRHHCKCESCNKEDAVEVHHIRPLSIGGADDESNYIALCEGCHISQHSKNKQFSKSRLTKFAIYKKRYGFNKSNTGNKLISKTDFYHIMNFLCECKEPLSVVDVMDIIDDLPTYGVIDEQTINQNFENVIDWLERI